MKKIINNPTDVVSEALMGMQAAYPDKLVYTPKMEVISRKEKKTDKVAVISGGGAGHEPLHAGFVGKGMLDAAISGNVFSSPSPDRIGSAIEQVSCGKGVLMVIKNYSGDIMNFGLSADLAEMDDIEVAQVVVKDDVAVPDREEGTGRRGIAGTVFVHKIAGAKAEQGASLAEVKEAAEKAVRNIRTMGVAMTPCTLPAVGKPGFQIADDEIEIGMGIHGEQGVETTKIKTAKEIAEILVGRILADYDYTGSEVAVLVNGLGGTPLMELYILNLEVQKLLKEKGIKAYRTFVGNYCTAIDMTGASVTLMKLDDELKELLDAPCDTPALKI
ncbi:dihydroxyacetone kinase subunit DhaK [Oribacterium sp. P9]|uniref:dihydroxyacetone kinase subunit DhaK n=1 Tax=Oribacterium sp. P9 TaxID=3378068 RepID=UPI002A7C1732|nr:dihydroxyacetone kinase subunit DhaK [Oribacterium sp.]MDY2854843.1 dihydroxyacetone kinase subunit DhaK [Oliverpabstia sp.]